MFVKIISSNFNMHETDFHNKDVALSLTLKWRLRSTLKWPIGLFQSLPGLFLWRRVSDALGPTLTFPALCIPFNCYTLLRIARLG